MYHIKNYDSWKSLNEKSFNWYDNNYLIDDKYIKKFINDNSNSFYLESLLQEFIESEGYSENKEEIINSKEFLEYLSSILEEYLGDAKSNLLQVIDYKTGKICIYRALRVEDKWIEHLKSQGKHLGIYWTWDKEKAEVYWGLEDEEVDSKVYAIIEAEVDEKNVNWEETIEMNANPHYYQECEIRLFKNTPISIKNVTINGEIVNIESIKDKQFYS